MSPSRAARPQSGTKQLQPLAHVSSLKFLFEELRPQVRTETRFRDKSGLGKCPPEVPLPPYPPSRLPWWDWLASSPRLQWPVPDHTLILPQGFCSLLLLLLAHGFSPPPPSPEFLYQLSPVCLSSTKVTFIFLAFPGLDAISSNASTNTGIPKTQLYYNGSSLGQAGLISNPQIT